MTLLRDLRNLILVTMIIVSVIVSEVDSGTAVSVVKVSDIYRGKHTFLKRWYHGGVHGGVGLGGALGFLLGPSGPARNKVVVYKYRFYLDSNKLRQDIAAVLVDSIGEETGVSVLISRIVRLDKGLVWEIFHNSGEFAEISVDSFVKEYVSQRAEAVKKSKKRYDKEHRPRKKRSKRFRDLKLKRYGFWKDRFIWAMDSSQQNTTYLGEHGMYLALDKVGVVKKRDDDTLFYKRRLVLVESAPELEAIDDFYDRLVHYEDTSDYFRNFVLNYHKPAEMMSYDFDTTTLDFVSTDSNVPLVSTLRISINERHRGQLLRKRGYIRFANEEIPTDNRFSDVFYVFDSIAVESFEAVDFPAGFFDLPRSLKRKEFKGDQILRFFE